MNIQDQLMWEGLGTSKELAGWLGAGEIQLNGLPAVASSSLFPDDLIDLRGHSYRVGSSGIGKRLQVSAEPGAADAAARIEGEVRVHCGLHKCLTMYFRNVLRTVCRRSPLAGISFRHFFHREDAFYRECNQYRVTSLSGHTLDLDRFADIRVTRFVRDPRDLLVSGYHYHKRGAEHWCGFVNPMEAEWAVVNGAVPAALPQGVSLREYLNTVSVEEGLLAELDFRRHHFASMRHWQQDSRVLTFKYEDILGQEADVFEDIFRFYGLSWLHAKMARLYAARLSASRGSKGSVHIRNPGSGQWRQHFTPLVEQRFNDLYGDLLEQYDYARH